MSKYRIEERPIVVREQIEVYGNFVLLLHVEHLGIGGKLWIIKIKNVAGKDIREIQHDSYMAAKDLAKTYIDQTQ